MLQNILFENGEIYNNGARLYCYNIVKSDQSFYFYTQHMKTIHYGNMSKNTCTNSDRFQSIIINVTTWLIYHYIHTHKRTH